MAKKPYVDVRKLKDEATEFLKKQKWEKAAEVLEALVAAEPKDMSHRLKLGDTYRRMEDAAVTSMVCAPWMFARQSSDDKKATGEAAYATSLDAKRRAIEDFAESVISRMA